MGKSDWQIWTTFLNNNEYKNMVEDAMWQFINDTEDRILFTDYYRTDYPDAERGSETVQYRADYSNP